MSQRNVINGIRMATSLVFEGARYYIDIDDNIYLYDKLNSRISKVTDKDLLDRIWNKISPQPIDIEDFGGSYGN